jgi:indolepyruvate ferredoxin oxidoreductase
LRALASVPQLIRGFGHVKEASARKARAERGRLIERLKFPAGERELEAAE